MKTKLKRPTLLKKEMKDIHSIALEQCEEFDKIQQVVNAVNRKHGERRSNNKGSIPTIN